MTGVEKLGLLANLERCKAQQLIQLGKYDPTNYQAVRDLWLQAYDDPKLAQRAMSAAAERLADARMQQAREARNAR